MQNLTPYYDDGTTTIYQGDALAVVPALDELVDVVIADPPYSSGGRTSSERTRATSTKYVSSDAKRELPEFVGDCRDQHGHAHWCALWLSACLQRTRPGGLCFVWTDWRQLAATSDALQAGGWTWRGVVVWAQASGSAGEGEVQARHRVRRLGLERRHARPSRRVPVLGRRRSPATRPRAHRSEARDGVRAHALDRTRGRDRARSLYRFRHRAGRCTRSWAPRDRRRARRAVLRDRQEASAQPK